MTRSYAPISLDALARAHGSGLLPAGLARFTAVDDSEESEYQALWQAADAAAERMAPEDRRVVLVIDPDPGAGELPWRLVAAIHADPEPIARDTALGEDAPELAWFATQEISDLLGQRFRRGGPA